MDRRALRKPLPAKKINDTKNIPENNPPSEPIKLSGRLTADLGVIRDALGESMDVVIREFYMGQTRAALIYIDGIVDRIALRENILKALMVDARLVDPPPDRWGAAPAAPVKERVLSVCCVSETREFSVIINSILGANIALLFDGDDTALALRLPGYETRPVEEPHTENVVRGPREGFVESLAINISMLRRKIKSPRLRLERMQLGGITATDICIAHIEGVANPKIVDEIKIRLGRVEIDGILESGYLESFLEDAPFSIFPTVGNTEKPDKVAAHLLEGRVAVFTDGTPYVLTVPHLFTESIQVSEDYYSRHFFSSMLRVIRTVALILTTGLPALYVSASSFSPEAVPTPLLLTMAAAREGIPLPALGEVLVMGLIFEILREAGVRLPRPIGQAVSIVGALVIGEAAVTAGLVSAPAVIVTAVTGVSSFVVPAQSDAHFFIRLFLTLLAGFAGFFGFFLGFAIVLTHLASLRSLGMPYLSPMAPLSAGDLKDVFVRVPWWAMFIRPRVTGWRNPRRAGAAPPPSPPRKKQAGGR